MPRGSLLAFPFNPNICFAGLPYHALECPEFAPLIFVKYSVLASLSIDDRSGFIVVF